MVFFDNIESEGTATFAKGSDYTYWIIDGEQKLQLQNAQGVNYGDNTTPDWDGAAVEANDSGGYEILLQGQNNFSGKAYVWTTNSDGVIIEGSGWKSGGALSAIEEKFEIDFNYDELTDSPLTYNN